MTELLPVCLHLCNNNSEGGDDGIFFINYKCLNGNDG